MTENNRFEIGMLKNYVNDNKTNYCYVLEVTSDARHLCNLLNQLNNKNEQLKSTINTLTHDNTKMKKVLNTTKKENEQLKQSINEVVELLSEEVDLFSDKATEHDINAYRELNELDNKDAYYMAVSTKKAIKMLKELEE